MSNCTEVASTASAACHSWTSSRANPGPLSGGRESRTAGAREGELSNATRFSGAEPEQAQAGFGEVIDGTFGHPPGVALVETEQTEQPPRHGAQRDLGVGDGEAAGGLAGANVTKRVRCQAAGCIDELQPGPRDEAGDLGVGPGETAGDPEGDSEDLGGVAPVSAGAVDHLRPAVEHLS